MAVTARMSYYDTIRHLSYKHEQYLHRP